MQNLAIWISISYKSVITCYWFFFLHWITFQNVSVITKEIRRESSSLSEMNRHYSSQFKDCYKSYFEVCCLPSSKLFYSSGIWDNVMFLLLIWNSETTLRCNLYSVLSVSMKNPAICCLFGQVIIHSNACCH